MYTCLQSSSSLDPHFSLFTWFPGQSVFLPPNIKPSSAPGPLHLLSPRPERLLHTRSAEVAPSHPHVSAQASPPHSTFSSPPRLFQLIARLLLHDTGIPLLLCWLACLLSASPTGKASSAQAETPLALPLCH